LALGVLYQQITFRDARDGISIAGTITERALTKLTEREGRLATKSDRKGNPVIYLALTLPGVLVAVALSSTLARHSHWIGQPRAIEVPESGTVPSNPATLIKPQNVKYIG